MQGRLMLILALKQGLETRDRCGCAFCVAAGYGYVTLLRLGRSRHRRIACVLIIGTMSHALPVIASHYLPSLVLCLFTFSSLFLASAICIPSTVCRCLGFQRFRHGHSGADAQSA